MIQTNRTLLVEEIEPNRDNIVSIVRYIENRESFSDEEIAEIHSRLEVSSFEEVIEKFSPQIYLSLDTDSMQASFHRRRYRGMDQGLAAGLHDASAGKARTAKRGRPSRI